MHFLKGAAASVSIVLTTLAVYVPLTWWIISLLWTRGEALQYLKQRMDKIIIWWTGSNRRMIEALRLTETKVTWHERDTMSAEHWYLVISNHQSWSDILLLQSHLYGTIPPLKFFTKQQLIWIPFIGLAMYVLGFPYVKRVTKDQIKANPKLKSADKENVSAACEGFKNHPTSILNFVEGTRRTAEKQARQKSEFKHLLRPKVGGLDTVIEGMDGYLHRLIDVTIVYPQGTPTFWEFLQGKCSKVEIEIQPYEIPVMVRDADASTRRAELAQWVRGLWEAKDARIDAKLNEAA